MRRGSTGKYETTSIVGEKISAFVPDPLPPEPTLELNDRHQRLMERATVALGRLDSVTLFLPDPNIFLYAYIRREAVLSSQIEGTQSSFAQLLLYEIEQLDIVREITGQKRNRVFAYQQYLNILNEGTESP